jgi:integrase
VWLAVARTYERMLIGDLQGARQGSERAIEVGSRCDAAACALRRVAEARLRILGGDIVQRQLGHSNLGTTSIYLQGIDPEEIIGAVRARRPPMMSASAGLRL